MGYPKVKGSIILKLLVIITMIGLAFAIYIPNQLWTLEQAEEDECHFRMLALTDVQGMYSEVYNGIYADSLSKIIELINTYPEIRASCDSIVQIRHDEETAELIKTGKPFRLYHDVPITVDSIFHCPSSGLQYILEWESFTKYKIFCPQEEKLKEVYHVFKKEYENHGNINQNKNGSWQ